MQIELIGCTSAGKTTLAKRIVQAGRASGIDAQMSDDFVLKLIGLNRIKNEFMRRRVIELLSFLICLMLWPRYRKFYHLAIRTGMQAPGSWFYKLNVARIVLRKIGIYELIHRFSSERQVILVDNEGVLQACHTLFVHRLAHSGSNAGDVAAFVRLAPLPDVVLYLRQPESLLIGRVLQRGHHRLPERSYEQVQRFVRQAQDTFEALQQQQALTKRLLIFDGERNALSALKDENDPLLVQTRQLLENTLTGRTEQPVGTPPQETKTGVGLTIRLVEALNRQGVQYCHWKSNFSLAQTLAGELDLDLLVSRKSLPAALMILNELGFKAALAGAEPVTPGIFHYYGFDPRSGRIIHVHLFSCVLTGESFVKSHFLPFETMVLENVSSLGPFRIASKPAELVLFVLSTFVKYGSLVDRRRLKRRPEDIRAELNWLMAGTNISAAVSLLAKYCPVVEEALFRRCLAALDEPGTWTKRLQLARAVRKRLRVYAKYSPLQRLRAYARFARRRLGGNSKKLHAGGAIIAFVGADATGKSTLVAETGRWLGKIFAVKTAHVGKPPASWLTLPLRLALPWCRRLLPQFRRNGILARSLQTVPSQHPAGKPPSLIYAIRAVALAWDRRRLLFKVRHWAANGAIVICDRYPSETTGAMDSPRLTPRPKHGGKKTAFYNWLARLEQRLYKQMPPPDLVLKLKVSLATAKIRNRSRTKNNHDADDYLETRHRESREWQRPGTKYFCDIDTERSLAETMLSVKQAVWELL